MKILHTADWHLGDRLGRIDRTNDLRRAVERVAAHCERCEADVLLVAGDLFSELIRPEGLRDACAHLMHTFEPFLGRGGTILTLTGNHDNENFCQTLRHAMTLAAPDAARFGARAAVGRLYLATEPTLFRLPDRASGTDVQFVLMPYPTPTRYLDREATPRYQSQEERNRHLQSAYAETLRRIQQDPRFDASLPAVLSAHVHVHGSDIGTLFRITEEEDVILSDSDLGSGFAYVALGHIHRAQFIGGRTHVRYSGSIERMDLGEQNDDKGVLLVEVGPEGLRGEPLVLPLESTPVYRIEFGSPNEPELERLRDEHPDAANDLVRIEFTYAAGVDNLEKTLGALEEIFPRYYYRTWTEAGALGPTLTVGEARARSFEETVREYLDHELMNHEDDDRRAVLERAEGLMRAVMSDE